MSDKSIAFLSRPIQTMAHRGERFTLEVIDTLRRWFASGYTETVRIERHGKIFALSAERYTPWHIIVILHDRRHTDIGANVCAVEFGQADVALDHFMPLIAVDHIQAAMHVRLHKIEPKMFTAMAAGQTYAVPGAAMAGTLRSLGPSRVPDVMAQVDAAGHRWASSHARSRFKDVFDRARRQPQIVERGDDDLVVMSRTYLQELISPTSAQAMARYYRTRGLSLEALRAPEARALDDLEVLPDIGAA